MEGGKRLLCCAVPVQYCIGIGVRPAARRELPRGGGQSLQVTTTISHDGIFPGKKQGLAYTLYRRAHTFNLLCIGYRT